MQIPILFTVCLSGREFGFGSNAKLMASVCPSPGPRSMQFHHVLCPQRPTYVSCNRHPCPLASVCSDSNIALIAKVETWKGGEWGEGGEGGRGGYSLGSFLVLPSPSSYCLLHGRPKKSREEVLGQGIATLFRKPADREGGGLMSQRTILPRFGC